MSTITVIDRDGAETEIEAKEGWTLMEIIREAGLPIEAACGGCCACATCHVYVDADWTGKLPEKEDEEEDMLDLAFDVEGNSRLSCQVKYTPELAGIRLTLAPD